MEAIKQETVADKCDKCGNILEDRNRYHTTTPGEWQCWSCMQKERLPRLRARHQFAKDVLTLLDLHESLDPGAFIEEVEHFAEQWGLP